MSDEPELTADGHHIVVRGRKWRATDPSIPAALRAELVAELMAARRAVHHDRDDPNAVAAARRRVHDAKTALGERGDPWWTPPTPDGRRTRIQATIRALLSKRGTTQTTCPSDIARIVASPDWRPSIPEVRAVALAMADTGDITVWASGEPTEQPNLPAGPPMRLALPEPTPT